MFTNKVVLVTGGSAGIGAATAILFAKEKASVAIVGRNEVKLKEVAQICENLGSKVLTIKADISKETEAGTVVKRTVEKFGKLDVLVNNAGIVRFTGIAEDNILEVYDEILNTNLRAVVQITHLAVPYLKKTKGNIINVSSICSTKVLWGGILTIYGISKAAMDHFTKSTALELGPFGVRVNSINPGVVKTEIVQKETLPKEILKKMNDYAIPSALGKDAESDEIGDLMVYLASDKAKSITGSIFFIDNGTLVH